MLMVGFLRPHVPWYVPKKYFDMYDRESIILPPYKADDLDDVPEAGRSTINEGYPRTEWAIENNHWKHIVQSYLASITFVDTKIGMVLNALEESPYRDNTIVILWSDHGYHMGEKNTFQKHTLWDRSAVVPMIIKLPSSMESEMKRGRCDRVVGLTDLYPTLVDLCGLPANTRVVGRSLKPLLKNPGMSWDYPAITFGRDDGKSLQYGDYRFIKYGDGSMELYDHSTDPNEWTNLAANPQYQQLLSDFKTMLNEYTKEKSAGEWIPIFNGTSLEGWHVACVDEDKGKGFWRVEDGTIACNSMGHPDHDYIWLCTDREFTDFEMKLKFKVFRDNKGNSGVQIRSRYDRSPDAPGGGWLDGPQVDIHPKGPWRTGLIYDETRGARGWIFPFNPGSGIQEELVNHDVVFKFADQGDGWNTMVLTCEGTRIKTEVNDVVVCNEDFAGIIDSEAHKERNVGLKGHLALQIHRKAQLNMRFKDLYVKDLTRRN
jgi:hypothetical protein